jgi:hypothetical protein
MPNGLYDAAKQSFLQGDIDWINDNIKVVLVDTATYAVDLANDDFLDDIPVGERVATSINLSGKSSTGGVADATEVTFTGVSGDEAEALVVYKDTGDAGTSNLICYIDTASAGLPITPNGADITVTWDDGANKIFAL